MDSGLKLWGILGASAIVLSNDNPALVKAAARLAKVVFGNRIQICDGTDDHVEIQAAIDALPASGGEVKLLDGTYNIEVLLTLDTDQTFRGCGRNTILATSTDDLVFLSAVGGSGTEKTGIVIADLQIDGGSGKVGECGIYFEYVDYSFITNVYSRRHDYGKGSFRSGICLRYSDFNTLTDNVCRENGYGGIYLTNSDNNIVSDNVCQGNSQNGIYVSGTDNNIVKGNNCQGNTYHGIYLTSGDGNIVRGNDCRGNGRAGIYASSADNNNIGGNTCIGNSQTTDVAYDNIQLVSANYNLILGNLCRDGGGAKQPRYGINIYNVGNGNVVKENDLYDSGKTANFNDAGTDTKLAVYVVPFSDGTDPQDSGFEIDANTEMARAWLRLPAEVQQVVRMKVYARSVVTETHEMELQMVVLGGADNEAYNTHDGSIAQLDSVSVNFAADDIIHWVNTEAGTLALVGGDSVEVKVLHEAAEGDNCETDAFFRTVEIEYV